MSMTADLPVIGEQKGHALAYGQDGFEVFPVNPKDKTPLVSQYKATTDEAQITGWWDRWPDALIGHRFAADVIALDIDPRHNGNETWRKLVEVLELDVPTTRSHYSGRNDGGGHLWYRRPEGRLTITGIDRWAREHGTGHAIDGPGDRWVGGLDLLHRTHRYTILPPSPHPETGLPYRWRSFGEIEDMPPELAALLVDHSPPPKPFEPKPYDGDSIADWFSSHRSWNTILPRHGWTLRAGGGDDDGSQWRHPTATSPVSATVRHGCLFVYSPNTPFDVTSPDDPHGYTRFAAFTLLEHGGDASAAALAARELRDGPVAAPGSAGSDFVAPEHYIDPQTGEEVIDDVVEERKPSTWTPVDLTEALEGIDVPAPEFWLRSDGVPLVYAGRTHWFQGPSESLKSMAAQMVTAEALSDGRDVLYIDFEDDDRGVVARLLSMGCEPDSIKAHLVYLRPDEALMDRAGRWTPGGLDYLETLSLRSWSVAILDGVTEAMTTEGMEIIDNADTARWMRLLPKRISDTGAAVVVIDHTTKNSESAGRFAIGAQHKLAGVTGATYKFELVRPLARADMEPITGQVQITVTKDRPGWVRGRTKDGQVGMFEVTSYPDGGLEMAVMAPGAESAAVDMELIGEILRYLDTYEGATVRLVSESLDVRAARSRDALKAAIGRGWVEVRKVGTSHQHYLTIAGQEVMK